MPIWCWRPARVDQLAMVGRKGWNPFAASWSWTSRSQWLRVQSACHLAPGGASFANCDEGCGSCEASVAKALPPLVRSLTNRGSVALRNSPARPNSAGSHRAGLEIQDVGYGPAVWVMDFPVTDIVHDPEPDVIYYRRPSSGRVGSQCEQKQRSAAMLAGKPGQRFVHAAERLVLEPHAAAVAQPVQLPEELADGLLPRAGLVPPRHIGDLHVRDQRPKLSQRRHGIGPPHARVVLVQLP